VPLVYDAHEIYPEFHTLSVEQAARLVGGGGFGTVAKLDSSETFATAIAAMFDPAAGGPERFRPRLAASAGRFSWRSQGRTLVDIYRELLSTSAPTSVGGH
jgi:hypothetical protein